MFRRGNTPPTTFYFEAVKISVIQQRFISMNQHHEETIIRAQRRASEAQR